MFCVRHNTQGKLDKYKCSSYFLTVPKTKKHICDAFMRLREKKPVEKISVTELCSLAGINKSTFYAHYRDIYDLSDKIETQIVMEIVSSIENPQNIFDNPNKFTKDLFYAYTAKEKIISVVFSGSRAAMLPQKTEYILKKMVFRFRPEYENDVEKNVLFSLKIYGGFYAFQVNKKFDVDEVISVISDFSGQLFA